MENHILILRSRIKNGFGDFIHLREMFRLIRKENNKINIGFIIDIELQHLGQNLAPLNRSGLYNLILDFLNEDVKRFSINMPFVFF